MERCLFYECVLFNLKWRVPRVRETSYYLFLELCDVTLGVSRLPSVQLKCIFFFSSTISSEYNISSDYAINEQWIGRDVEGKYRSTKILIKIRIPDLRHRYFEPGSLENHRSIVSYVTLCFFLMQGWERALEFNFVVSECWILDPATGVFHFLSLRTRVSLVTEFFFLVSWWWDLMSTKENYCWGFCR